MSQQPNSELSDGNWRTRRELQQILHKLHWGVALAEQWQNHDTLA